MQDLLFSFFAEATRALETCQTDEPLTLPECRSLLLRVQQDCLQKVVDDHNNNNNASVSSDHPLLNCSEVQGALASLSATYDSSCKEVDNADKDKDPTGKQQQQQQLLYQAMEEMNHTARLSFARLILTSECLRLGVVSFNDDIIMDATTITAARPLKTCRMMRHEMLEFCALCQAAIQLETVQAHIQDAGQVLEFLPATTDSISGSDKRHQNAKNNQTILLPPMKRLETMQRLLLQALGYDADIGLTELARQVQMEDGNDDVELVQVIRQTTALLLEGVLGDTTTQGQKYDNMLLSDQDQGGVTRVVSVQHSESIVILGGSNDNDDNDGGQPPSAMSSATAPISQSMRQIREEDDENDYDEQQQRDLQMAREAAKLRASMVQELLQLNDLDRTELLERAQQALQTFQEDALQIPPGPKRIEFLRNMDAHTQKLLAMHRIWLEHTSSSSQSKIN